MIRKNIIPSSVTMEKSADIDNYFIGKLFQFETSIQLPSDLRALITDLHKALDDNLNLMITVFNEQYSQNANNIIGDQDNTSPYLGKTTNLYWKEFIPLKPKADNITDAIRSYLKVSS
jgi:hypothetical protein